MLKNMIIPLSIAAVIMGMPISQALAEDSQAKIFGWIENGLILPGNIPVKVKLDTGAKTSSLDAKHLEEFKKDGQEWVRFNIEVKSGHQGKQFTSYIERKIQRKVNIRGAGGTEHRPVVLMDICIGNKILSEEFSLKDRAQMLYPVLLGRQTLEKLGAVDSEKTFTVKPTCNP